MAKGHHNYSLSGSFIKQCPKCKKPTKLNVTVVGYYADYVQKVRSMEACKECGMEMRSDKIPLWLKTAVPHHAVFHEWDRSLGVWLKFDNPFCVQDKIRREIEVQLCKSRV